MRILLAGGDGFPGDDVEQLISDFGAEVVGPAHNVDVALQLLLSSRVDGAILDLYLDAKAAFQIADALMMRNTPFIFASTVASEQLPGRFKGYHLVAKPEEMSQIIMALFGQPH